MIEGLVSNPMLRRALSDKGWREVMAVDVAWARHIASAEEAYARLRAWELIPLSAEAHQHECALRELWTGRKAEAWRTRRRVPSVAEDLTAFVADHCFLSADVEVSVALFGRAFNGWAAERGAAERSARAITQELHRLGIRSTRTKSERKYAGVTLVNDNVELVAA